MRYYFLIFLTLSSVSIKAESIIIDGVLDEPEWASAFSINEFYQTSPFNLKKTEDETLAYIFSNKMVSMLVLSTSKVILRCYQKKH
jgi:hypothetical protein